tara:strand:+ start:1623 stop:2567 length:945 start_codon:yes stop_codon:yes gene_type:complete
MKEYKFDINNKKIYVAGSEGMVGSAVCRELEKENCKVIKTPRSETDLIDKHSIDRWMSANNPDAVIICAAKVGGIMANQTYPVDFLYNNLMMQCNLINSSFEHNVKKLVFLGSSCIYPKFSPQPIKEETLLSGNLERSNEWYAIAKIAGIKLCQAYRKQYNCDFISAMPTNLYGTNDNFDLENSHVIPALIRKCYEAKKNNNDTLAVWGSGNVRREFMHVDDCAKAIIFLLKVFSDTEHINIGTGSDITIKNLVEIIKKIFGYKGNILFDSSKPEGTPQKLLDVSKINKLGWKAKIDLEEGLKKVIGELKEENF